MEQFETIGRSHHQHWETYISSSTGDSVLTCVKHVLDTIFAVGSYSGSSSDKISTELLDTETLKWSVKSPYPYASQIRGVRSLYYQGRFFTFGGYTNNGCSNRIDAFDPSQNGWFSVGQMKSKRHHTSVIESNDEFLIVGAYWIGGDKNSEKCTFQENGLVCEYQLPIWNDIQG